MSGNLLQVSKLCKEFTTGGGIRKPPFRAVDQVSFSLRRGEVLAIVGESGSGKSTIARMVTHLIDPTSGEVELDGVSIYHNKRLRKAISKHIQMIFQDPFAALNPSHKIGHIIGRPLKIQKRVSGSPRKRVLQLLDQVGLTPAEDFIDKYPYELSGGQKQRVVIAKVLGLNPSVIVADEPTSMLDVSIGIGIMNLLLDLKENNQLSYLFITHSLGSARYMADRIMVMFGGQVMEYGDTEDVIQAPKHPYTRQLLNASPDPWREPAASETDKVIEEEKGNLLPAEGCKFQHRCPHVMPACRIGAVPGIPVTGSRQVRCLLYENEVKTS